MSAMSILLEIERQRGIGRQRKQEKRVLLSTH
jgi:hypothetical protein